MEIPAAPVTAPGKAPALDAGPAVKARDHDGYLAYLPGEYVTDNGHSWPLTDGGLEILPVEHVWIESALDSVGIEMGIFRPAVEDGVRVPVIVDPSPYWTEQAKPGEGVEDGRHWFKNTAALIAGLVPNGYAVVTLAARGTAGSGGCPDFLGPSERADVSQAITWLAEQEWSTGNIAVTGLSYDGGMTWGAAASGNPHVKTIVPIAGVKDLAGLNWRNGTAEGRAPAMNAIFMANPFGEVGMLDAPATIPQRAACPDTARALASNAYATATWGQDLDGYYADRNIYELIEENYQGSVFVVVGLQDWNVDPGHHVPWLGKLEERGLKVKTWVGNWDHRYPDQITRWSWGGNLDGHRSYDERLMRWDYMDALLRWFDQELKGIETPDLWPHAQVQDDLLRWRFERQFPPADAEWLTTYPDASGTLAETPGDARTVTLRPAGVSGRGLPDVSGTNYGYSADFALPPSQEDLLISGLPLLPLELTPHGPGGYIGAHLYEKAPTGELRRIGWTTMNLEYADGTGERTPVTAGQKIVAKMQFQPMDSVVRAHSELVLRVWINTEGYLMPDEQPLVGMDRMPTTPFPVDVHFGGDSATTLRLPVIERDPEDYFDAYMPK